MATVITAPMALPDEADLFIAGGISNCPNWQETIITSLSDTELVMLNPRRSGVLIPEEATAQIAWEVDAFKRIKTVLFWFPAETLCPITLFELGRFAYDPTVKLFVGTHPDYQRRLDVVEQLNHVRPGFLVVDSLEDLAAQVHVWNDWRVTAG